MAYRQLFGMAMGVGAAYLSKLILKGFKFPQIMQFFSF